MTKESIEITPALGDYLRATRREQGWDLSTVAEETKISHRNLQAIEESNYSSLPAEAFTRGFYRLYANILSLDPEDIIKRYDTEKASLPKTSNQSNSSYKTRDQDVGIMAERPSFLTFSSFGLILFLLLFFGAFLCWYFSWNPATFLSQKLRSLENDRPMTQQTQVKKEVSADFSRLFGMSYPRSAVAATTYKSKKTTTEHPESPILDTPQKKLDQVDIKDLIPPRF
ncbi:MAG: helix-turn-helix domain-containing protein [Desulfobulbaceae bacterium]|nr:helix-turn-helix domain-containing protein [Desulfobulbaceae bacterium]